jgi:hypothetical protein
VPIELVLPKGTHIPPVNAVSGVTPRTVNLTPFYSPPTAKEPSLVGKLMDGIRKLSGGPGPSTGPR